METRVASARDGDFDPQNWWEKRKSAKVFMREIVGMAETIWEFRYGAESSTTTQGIVELGGLTPQCLV